LTTGLAYEAVNDTSLRIGDYEALKEAALDPYVAIRDAYVQNRNKLIAE
jgi:phospholipid-binding lipoprotein MlaA